MQNDVTAAARAPSASVEPAEIGDGAGRSGDDSKAGVSEWKAMLGKDDAAEDGGFPQRQSTRVLNQDEMDSLLGFDDEREEVSAFLKEITASYNNVQEVLAGGLARSLHNIVGRLLCIIRERDEEIECLKMAENRPCPYPEGPCAESRHPTTNPHTGDADHAKE